MTSWLGPLGPGFFRNVGENRSRYFRFLKSTAKSRMRKHNKTTKSEKYPQISNSPGTGNGLAHGPDFSAQQFHHS